MWWRGGRGPVRHPGRAAPTGVGYFWWRGQEERPARRRPGFRYDADDAAHVVPALALTRDDGDDPGKGLSVIETLGLYVLIPLALFAVIAGLVFVLDSSHDRHDDTTSNVDVKA